MATIRRRLRTGAVIWILVQMAMLSSLVARDCCAAHRADTQQGCHEEQRAVFCPMRSADGAPCPMHGGSHSHEQASRCAIRGDCDGPMSAVLVWLSTHGVLTRPFEFAPEVPVSLIAGLPRDVLPARPSAPDTPPPRL